MVLDSVPIPWMVGVVLYLVVTGVLVVFETGIVVLLCVLVCQLVVADVQVKRIPPVSLCLQPVSLVMMCLRVVVVETILPSVAVVYLVTKLG